MRRSRNTTLLTIVINLKAEACYDQGEPTRLGEIGRGVGNPSWNHQESPSQEQDQRSRGSRGDKIKDPNPIAERT